MIKLDDNLLQELGLGVLPPDEKKKMLAHIYETLEMRVGMELAKQMSDAQLNEFEEFINRNDEAGALKWLEANFPNYKDVVAEEFEKLKAEIKQVAPQIVSASSQSAAPQEQPMQPGDPYQQLPPQQPGGQPPANY
jgi:predicted RNA-binding Zn ribbon-like protein